MHRFQKLPQNKSLHEIKIKRISKFDSFKADEYIKGLEDDIVEVKNHLDNLVDYADEYFPRFFAHVAWADNEDTREQCLAHNKAHEKALLQDMQRLYSIVKRETLSLLSDIQTFLFPFVVPNLRFCERFHAAQREMKLLEWYCEKMLQYEGLVMEYGHTP